MVMNISFASFGRIQVISFVNFGRKQVIPGKLWGKGGGGPVLGLRDSTFENFRCSQLPFLTPQYS